MEGAREDPFSTEPDLVNGADEFAAIASRLPLGDPPKDDDREPSILKEEVTTTDADQEDKADWNAFSTPTVVHELQQSGEISAELENVQEGNEEEEKVYDEVAKNAPDTESKDPIADELDDLAISQVASGSGSIVGDVLYSIATGEGEGRSRQRILAFAAKRYENAVQRNSSDYDALYNWALVLQESADNTGPDSGGEARDRLLEEACKKYAAATELCPTLHEAYYNWAIAISDRAKIRGRREEAQTLWRQACEKYERAVQLNWDSPQALNNWGLALQELGTIVPLREKAAIVKKAISKFRAAIRLRFDFHRAVYNLGTVLYGRAEDILRSGRKGDGKQLTPQSVYAQSAVYICAAHALKPDYPVYVSALRLVRKMLPLPFLKSGFLLTPPASGALTPHDTWTKRWFVLDHEALFEKPNEGPEPIRRPTTSGYGHEEEIDLEKTRRIDISSIVSVAPSSDFSLPAGGGFRIETCDSPPLYLVAETWDSMDGWVDAIRLVYTIDVRGKQDALIGVLRG